MPWPFDQPLDHLRRAARAHLIDAATTWAGTLHADPPPPDAATRPIVLTGHQVEFYHPGVWAKVIAVGPHARAVQSGDRVLFDADDKAEVEVHGELYIVMRERDVHAVAADRVGDADTGLYL